MVRPLLAVACVAVAANLRPAITAVGPLVGEIRSALEVSAAAAGLLTSLPLLSFAAAAPIAPVLARRYGGERVVLVALAVLAIGLIVRSAAGVTLLMAGTVIAGMAIGLGNVLLPGFVKQHFSGRAGLMMGVYSTTLAATAGVAAGVSVPLSRGLDLGWRGALAVWALPVGVAAAIWWAASRRTSPHERTRDGIVPRLRGSLLAWQVTVFMGLQSLLFYGLVTWLPTLLVEDGMTAARAGWMLAVFQLAGLSTTMTVPLLAVRRPNQIAPLALCVGVTVAGVALLWYGADTALVAATLLGIGSGGMFSLALVFLVLRAHDAVHAASLSGMAQSAGYLLAAAGPVGMGWLHDATGGWDAPLAALLAVMAGTLVAGVGAARDAKVGRPLVEVER